MIDSAAALTYAFSNRCVVGRCPCMRDFGSDPAENISSLFAVIGCGGVLA